LEIATARVIVVLGTPAKKAMQGEFNIPERVTVFGPITISGREKLITFLPHPNARLVRSFAKCLAFHEIEKLRAFLC
jgi:uracil-DNA glycosylase